MNWKENFNCFELMFVCTDEDYVDEYDLEYDNDYNSTAKGIRTYFVSFVAIKTWVLLF